MLLKGILTILCNTTIDTISKSFNITSCNLKFSSPNVTTSQNTSPIVSVTASPTASAIPEVNQQDSNADETARYAPTIIAGSGIGLITIASIIAFFLKSEKKDEHDDEDDFLENEQVNQIKEPENILSSNQFQRTYNII